MRNLLKVILFSVFVPLSGLSAAESEKNHSNSVEGFYKVQSIEKNSGHVVVQFEKYPASNGFKPIRLDVASLNNGLLDTGEVLEISAEVLDHGKEFLEAEQILLSLPRKNGKLRIWLLSRKGKGVLNMQNTSFLKMKYADDYLIL